MSGYAKANAGAATLLLAVKLFPAVLRGASARPAIFKSAFLSRPVTPFRNSQYFFRVSGSNFRSFRFSSYFPLCLAFFYHFPFIVFLFSLGESHGKFQITFLVGVEF